MCVGKYDPITGQIIKIYQITDLEQSYISTVQVNRKIALPDNKQLYTELQTTLLITEV